MTLKQGDLFDNQIIPNGHEKPFYNTIHAEGAELTQYEKDAKGQEKVILQLFESGNKMTPLEVERMTGINHDSCKRAITNLTKKGRLIKLGKEDMILEARGKMNHRWKINLLTT